VIRLFYLLFFLSGAAGLLYETIWAKYLGLFVGHEAYAQVLVLVIFLGGMAIGALVVSRLTTRLKRPLLGYALVEIAVGVLGLVFHDAFVGVTDWAYDTVFPALGGSVWLGAVKWTLAGALILPQSILLGATFPLMSAGLLRLAAKTPGRVLADLYFANSLGAALGALISSFVTIEASGLPGTVLVAAILNLVVAAVTVLLRLPPRATQADAAAVPAPVESTRDPALVRLLLAVSAGTAVASFIYEIDWIRMLALVLGSATHSFDLMLSAFILGLALGAFWTRRRADRFQDPLRALGTVQWVMGGLALATLPLYVASFHWMSWLMHALAKTDGGYAAFTIARYGICLVVMLPATFCAGVTLPLITRTLMVRGEGERAIGAVYASNTLGSIIGAAGAGLIALPLLGLKGMLVMGAALDMMLGVWLLHEAALRRGAPVREAIGAMVATAVAAGVVLLTPQIDRRLLTSGVYRFGDIPAPGTYEILLFRHGRTATVSVGRNPPNGERFIATNGKTDASLPLAWSKACGPDEALEPLNGDPATQALMAILPLAHAPHARTAATIGMGSGMTSAMLLGNPAFERVTTIEIEPVMVEGARLFQPANARVFNDPRSHIEIADAKSFFAAAGQKYDLIVSEPSNPWVSGVATLFTKEFYQRLRGHLTPDGVFGQWFHLYELDDALVLTVLAAVHESFPSYEVFLANETDLVVVASPRATLPAPDWSVVRLPGIAASLCHFLPLNPATLEAARVASRATLGPLFDDSAYAGHANSDFYPRLDLGAERTRYLGETSNGLLGLSSARFDLTAPFVGRRVAPFTDTLGALPGVPRVQLLALAARLRRAGPPGADADEGGTRVARFRLQQWNALLRGTEAPSNWRLWLEGMSEVEHDIAGGTQGVADEALYRAAAQFAERMKAPPSVRAAIAFRHAIARWDFPGALQAVGGLMPDAMAGEGLLPADELRDGAVVAALRAGEIDRAELWYRVLKSQSHRDDGDLRSLLLAAYLRAARGSAPKGRSGH
jgi:spermidine synthase